MLTYTRVLSGVIVPFLLAAFVILYVFPGETKRLFAWTIKPTMTPMVLASAYLGGAYFFVRVLRERRWTVIKTGFLSVALMLVAAVRARSELDPAPADVVDGRRVRRRAGGLGPPLVRDGSPAATRLADP